MRSHSYLNSAKKIIELYDGAIPLAAWLKEYFRVNRKFGSKDRREVSHICYCYFRLGNAFREMEPGEKMLLGLFLCSENSNFVLQELKPQWNQSVSVALLEKLRLAGVEEEIDALFPFPEFASKHIDIGHFNMSHLIQPSLFLRIRPGSKEKVTSALNKAVLSYELNGNCIRLPNGTSVEEILEIDKDVVIQDLNSQRTLDNLQNPDLEFQTAWDCCAASGGKSILLHDQFPSAHITVSDVRESILANLRKRFSIAGISKYESFVADVSSAQFPLNKKFDVVICDAPCSGSGTWGRTPEQLRFFKKERIGHYVSLQKKIAVNAAQRLIPGGVFIYITCSVFAAENEEVVAFIQSNTKLRALDSHYLKGYEKKADTLFVAVFR